MKDREVSVLGKLSSGAPAAVFFVGLFAAMSLLVAQVVPAQDEVPLNQGQVIIGKSLFRGYCKSCHGVEGKGDGPIADSLMARPADLTVLSQKNGGTFPFERIAKIIDGREKTPGHSNSDMPEWGDAFSRVDDGDEEAVQKKIEALAHFVRSIQVKSAEES